MYIRSHVGHTSTNSYARNGFGKGAKFVRYSFTHYVQRGLRQPSFNLREKVIQQDFEIVALWLPMKAPCKDDRIGFYRNCFIWEKILRVHSGRNRSEERRVGKECRY